MFKPALLDGPRCEKTCDSISQTKNGRYIGIFQIHNCVSRIKRPWTYINDSEDKFLIWSFVYNFQQFFQQFIVRLAISSKLIDCCLVHGPNRTIFHKCVNKDFARLSTK